MKKIYRNGLFMLAAGALVASCAEYNLTDEFKAGSDPSYSVPYSDLAPIKSYINKESTPNLTIGANLTLNDFNTRERAHAVAVTNFDYVTLGNSLMSGSIIRKSGAMDFEGLKTLINDTKENGCGVYGSAITGYTNQCYDWLKELTNPIEIAVKFQNVASYDYSTATSCDAVVTSDKGTAYIGQYQGAKHLVLENPFRGKMEVDIFNNLPLVDNAKYTITIIASTDNENSIGINFSGNEIEGPSTGGMFTVKGGIWTTLVVEGRAAEGAEKASLSFSFGNTKCKVYVKSIEIGYNPDPHREQTQEEISDTVHYAFNQWCDALMKYNAGHIKAFDLIEDPISTNLMEEQDLFNIRLSGEDEKADRSKILWQDIFGAENFGSHVSNVASAAFARYGGNPSELKFFVSESGLDNDKKFASLMYWVNLWESKGAKIDGINAKLNLTYYENEEKRNEARATFNTLLDKLVATGKLVRLSNFDIKYVDADNKSVNADRISDSQREALANYYAEAIKSFMTKVPSAQQFGITKGNMVDTSDPVGIWSKENSDWTRTVTYKAFCDALSGK